MNEKKEVANPGSTLGEAIGVVMESALNRLLQPLVESQDCVFITAGPKNVKTGKVTKLLLKDENGVEYNIDSVIANRKLQPLILIESKYIRYKKHNRDKGSWVCTAQQALRRRFSSIRSSITILAGSWSKTSKAMMRSYDITLFEIPFDELCRILGDFDIPFDWTEKDRETAYQAWNCYYELTHKEQNAIGDRIIGLVSHELRQVITNILDETVPRVITEVEIQVLTNLGEAKIFTFEDVESALRFLQDIDNEELLSTEDAPTLFDNASQEEG